MGYGLKLSTKQDPLAKVVLRLFCLDSQITGWIPTPPMGEHAGI